MGRKTVYNRLVTESLLKQINEENLELLEEWLEYLGSVDKSQKTIDQYENNFKIWCVWCLQNAKNKFFIDMTKRDVIKFQGYCINDLGHSPARVRSLRATLSSLSNYVERMLDDEFPSFRNIINKIEAPANKPVREKLILSDEEVEKLLVDLIDAKLIQQACYVALGASGGARKSELLRFKVDYFKDEYIENGLYKTPEKIESKGRGRGGKLIDKWTIASVFKPYFDLWMEEREKLGIDSEWLFVTKTGKGYEKAKVSTVTSWTRQISNILGQELYSHCLRHYATSYLIRKNVPAEVVKSFFQWDSDMVGTYNDNEASDEFSKYFSSDGVIQQEEKGLSDL